MHDMRGIRVNDIAGFDTIGEDTRRKGEAGIGGSGFWVGEPFLWGWGLYPVGGTSKGSNFGQKGEKG